MTHKDRIVFVLPVKKNLMYVDRTIRYFRETRRRKRDVNERTTILPGLGRFCRNLRPWDVRRLKLGEKAGIGECGDLVKPRLGRSQESQAMGRAAPQAWRERGGGRGPEMRKVANSVKPVGP